MSLTGFVFRMLDVGCRLVRGRLGLFGFVFSGGGERNIDATSCGIRGCGGFGVLEIGFVLHKKFDL